MAGKKRMSKKTKRIVKYTVAGLILLVEIVMIVVLVANSAKGVRDDSPVHSVLTVEAGEAFDLSSFVRDKDVTVTLSSDSRYDVNVPGNYALTLLTSGGESLPVTLKVRDTRPPEYTVLPPLVVKRGAQLKAEMLMPKEFIFDATAVRTSFISTEVSTVREGHYSATLRLIDGGGNITKVSSSFFVRENYNADYYYEIGDPAPQPGTIFPDASIEKWESTDFTPSVPGPVTVFLTMYGKDYFIRYEAKDTVAPYVVLRDEQFVFETGNPLPDPMSFIERIVDETATTVRYDQEYVLDRAEQKRVNIVVTDLGGNVTTVPMTVSVVDSEGEDTVPPRIIGTHDLVTEPGVRPDYLDGISVYDSRDGAIDLSQLKIDDSKVNYARTSSGDGYEVTYSVSDKAGNRATATIRVKIVQNVLTDEELDKFFDGILAEMGSLAGLRRSTALGRVYTLLTENYAITPGSAHTNLSDPRKEAYWGFKLKNGDSETACAMLGALLDRLDIEYIKVSGTSAASGKHSFLLVDYGFGWLYIDVMPTANYIWTTDGRLLRQSSEEAKALPPGAILRREAMTDADVDRLNDLSNAVTVGWNYYRIDRKDLPPTAERNADGSYTSPAYAVYYTVNNQRYGSITGPALQNVEHGGTTEAVTAVAAKGYKFVEWSDGFTEATRSDAVNREKQYEARFAPDSTTFTYYEINYTAEEGGSIDGNAKQSVLYGNKTTPVVARPDEFHYFDRWSDGLTAPSRQDAVTGKATYTAFFLPRKVLTYLAGEGGSVEGAATQYLVPGTQGSAVRAVPARGFVFDSWSDGVTDALRSDRPSEDLTLTANFLPDLSAYTVTYTAGAGGSIEGETTQTVVCRLKTVPVTAVAAEGYAFVGWSDGVTTAQRSDEVYGNADYAAIFEKIENLEFTLTYLAADGGSIAGESVQRLHGNTPGTPVEAVADDGWVFVSWSDGSTDPQRSDAISTDMVYIALFRKDETPVTTETPETPPDDATGG